MNTFNDLTEKLEFLKKQKLVAKTKSELPTFYYYAPASDTPAVCEIIGYEDVFESGAIIVIKTDDKILNIHSNYLLEMKERGTLYYKNKFIQENNTDNILTVPYIVLDIETTGLNYRTDQIIEIAAVKCIGTDIIEFQEYVRINSAIPARITQLTGISNETLAEADTIDIVLPRFLSFIGDYMLVGHNISAFDIPFINHACKDLRLPVIENKLTDTLLLAREKLPELSNHQLSKLCEYYNIDTANAHHAVSDCYMCNSLYCILMSDDAENETASNSF